MGFGKLNLSLVLLLVAGTSVHCIDGPECTHQLDVIAVVDGSDSIYDTDFIKLKEALIDLATNLNLENGQRFGAVVYSSTVSDSTRLSSNVAALNSTISKFGHPKMGTSTHLGIEKMNRMMKSQGRPGVPQVGIVITDGRSLNATATAIAAADSRANGIDMFAVGVGYGINTTELRNIASSEANVLELQNFDQLLDNVTSLVKKVCKVNGGWSNWSTVKRGTCSISCGGGIRQVYQERTCTNPAPSDGGSDCEGPSTQNITKDCKTKPCPVDGGWSEWSEAVKTDCSVTCGNGTRTCTQTRTCTNPRPENNGANCEGSETQTYPETCSMPACLVDGGWSEWSEVVKTDCSVTCGNGTRTCTQTRTCTNPRPENNGANCEGSETQTYPEPCSMPACLVSVDGGWSNWISGTKPECSVSCGGGSRTFTQTRSCTNPMPENGGTNCEGIDSQVVTEVCKANACPSSGDICDGCKYKNGVGYLPYPDDCGKYIHCVEATNMHYIMNCAPSLYWNQRHLVCDYPYNVVCTSGVAATTSTVKPPPTCTYGITKRQSVVSNNIDYREEVTSDGWVTKHCASGTLFDLTTCGCISEPGVPTCDKKAVVGNNAVYEQEIAGYAEPMLRQCAPGTVFDADVCRCVHDTIAPATVPPAQPASAGCHAELYLPFNEDMEDHSVYPVSIQNEEVTLITEGSEGYASFTANSWFRILRFSNMDFGRTVVISFLMYAGQSTAPNQAIVSNADCGTEGSIYIIQTLSTIDFLVRNKADVNTTLSVPRHNVQVVDRASRSQPLTRVSLTVHNGFMTAQVGNERRSAVFEGDIAKSHCALQIGRGTGYDNFIGNLDEFEVFLCVQESEEAS